MNKNRLFAVLFSILLIAGCSGDDDFSVVGTWNLFQFKVDCSMSGESFDFNATGGCYSFDGTESCFFISFRQDGSGSVTVTVDGESDVNEITYTSTDNDVMLCISSNDCSTLTLDGDRLVLEDSEDDCLQRFVFTKS